MINPQHLNLLQDQKTQETAKSLRNQAIDVFMSFRQRFQRFPREILFFALAIYEKYLLAVQLFNSFFSQKHAEMAATCLACTFLAWKAEGNRSLTIMNILELDDLHSVTREILIQEEEKILKALNFELPFDHSYAAMVREFVERDQTVRKNPKLAAECLVFYQKAIKLSSIFVLDSSLGPEIVRRIVDKQSRNLFIIKACEQIRHKTSSTELTSSSHL